MPSPFPGMDPYLELEEWQDFHVSMIVEFRRQLVPQLVPKYVAVVERRVYLEHTADEIDIFQPDVRIGFSPTHAVQGPHSPIGVSTTSTIEPEVYTAPLPFEHREPFIEVRDRESSEVVAVVEFLSPTNKTRSADGFREYSEKRESLLRGFAHLVEVDLLRGGVRPATTKPLRPTTDYCAMVHRSQRRPRIDVYQWPLRQRLPPVPVPLAGSDPDVRIDLQQAFESVYDSSGYRYLLRYDREMRPALRADDAPWVAEILSSFKSAP